MTPQAHIQYTTDTNKLIHKKTVSKHRTDSNYTNYSTKWHQGSKIGKFSLCCVCSWLFLWLSKLTGHLRLGHRVRCLPNPSSGRRLWQRCGCCNTKHTHKLVYVTDPNTFKHHMLCSLMLFGIPVPSGIGSCPLLFLPSFLWRTFLALAQLAETGGAHQLQPVQSPHEEDITEVKKNQTMH